MMHPRVHLNGTDRETLMRQTLDALEALHKAVEVLQAAAPNARDYYVISNTAYATARDEHQKRLHRLADNISELNEIAQALHDQKK